MDINRFIPFGDSKKNITTLDEQRQQELLALAISISVESAKLVENMSLKNVEASKNIAELLKEKIISISEKLKPQKPSLPSGYLAYTGTTHSMTESFIKDTVKDELHRALDNGGMAPPKEWRSITDLKLKTSEQHNLIEEMRKLNDKGISVSKSTFHHKSPATIEEFTEPFKYMENMHDYNGAFLITLLKSKAEIANQAATMQIDLSAEENSCAQGDKIILSVYDISGSVSSGEEKKFLITLLFDKLHGTLKFDSTIFMNGKKVRLSSRQLIEVDKFCKAKKINK